MENENKVLLFLAHTGNWWKMILTRFRHSSLVIKSVVEVILSGQGRSDSKHILHTRYPMDDCVVLLLEILKTMNGIIGLKL